jgi:hypothetical protein
VTWAHLSRCFGTAELIDLVFVIGCYECLAMAFNGFDPYWSRSLRRWTWRSRARLHGWRSG